MSYMVVSVRIFSLIIAAGVLIVLPHARANECDPSLFQALTKENVSDSKRLFFMQLINREDYEKIKSSQGFGATIPIDGVPLKATANFDEFNERRQSEYSRTNFKFDSNYARDYLATDLSSTGVQGYVSCLRGRTGLAAWIEPSTSTSDLISIRVSWRPVHYQGNRLLRVTYYGVSPEQSNNETIKLVDGGEPTLTVKRIPGQEFRATMNVDNAYSATIAIPPTPKLRQIRVTKTTWKKGTITWRGTNTKNEYPCLEASPGWSILPDTVSISPSNPGGPRPWGYKQQAVNSNEACYHIWLSRYSDDTDTVKWTISATESGIVEQFE